MLLLVVLVGVCCCCCCVTVFGSMFGCGRGDLLSFTTGLDEGSCFVIGIECLVTGVNVGFEMALMT